MARHSWLQMTVSVLTALSIGGCCCSGVTFRRLKASDLVGTWRADYEDCFDITRLRIMTGVETLTLRADGTYQQVYDDGEGYAYISPWNKWYLEDRRGSHILHLQGGRFYPLGIDFAEALAEGSGSYHSDDDGTGKPLDLDGTEVILHVRMNSRGEVWLHYPPVSDPDSLATVNFYLVATPIGTPTVLP